MPEYAQAICGELLTIVNPQKVSLILEPGASVLATSVDYLCEIINERMIRDTKILTTDGSSLHINPFLAARTPCIDWLYCNQDREKEPKQIICGCTCMENDRFIEIKDSMVLHVNDRLKITNAGAYTMAFNSCFINIPPQIYFKKDDDIQLLRESDSMLTNLI